MIGRDDHLDVVGDELVDPVAHRYARIGASAPRGRGSRPTASRGVSTTCSRRAVTSPPARVDRHPLGRGDVPLGAAADGDVVGAEGHARDADAVSDKTRLKAAMAPSPSWRPMSTRVNSGRACRRRRRTSACRGSACPSGARARRRTGSPRGPGERGPARQRPAGARRLTSRGGDQRTARRPGSRPATRGARLDGRSASARIMPERSAHPRASVPLERFALTPTLSRKREREKGYSGSFTPAARKILVASQRGLTWY